MKINEEEIKNQLMREIERLKDKKGFLRAGFPRFLGLFGRDSIISAWQLLDIDPEIAKNTLEILAKFQGKKIDPEKDEEPGKILHEHRLGKKRHPRGYFPFPYYGSIDSTPLFLILFSFYYEKTRDGEFLKKYWRNVLLALQWLFHFGDRDKDLFLEYKRKRKTGLFHQGWKDGFEDHLKIEPPVAIVEVQGYQYLALKEISDLAEMKKDLDLAKKLRKRAENLKQKFDKKFWMADKKYFALALDGKKRQKKTITSNPGHLLFTEILKEDKIKPIIKILFSSKLWTPYGIRTHSTEEPDFDPKSYHLGSIWPHDNWIIAQGLKKLGYQKEYQKIKNAIISAYKEIGFIPEHYGVIDNKITIEMKEIVCHPQAWASGALLNFLETK